jgi:hypothetical protein
LGSVLPKRLPLPAATMIVQTDPSSSVPTAVCVS